MRAPRLKAGAALLLCIASYCGVGVLPPARALALPSRSASPTPTPQAAVIPVTVISAERAANTLRALFPHARIRTDASASAVIVVARLDDVQQMRSIVQGIDVRNPQQPLNQVVALHILNISDLDTSADHVNYGNVPNSPPKAYKE